MKRYSKMPRSYMGKVAAGCLALALAGCTQEDSVAGIDGSGKQPDDIANGSSSNGLIVPPGSGSSSSGPVAPPIESSSSDTGSSSSAASVPAQSSSSVPPVMSSLPASSASSVSSMSSAPIASSSSAAPLPPVSSEPSTSSEPAHPSSSSVAPPPVPVKVVAQGPINGFGSVIVHGDRYDTDNALFFRNGIAATEESFEVGDMVTVFGYELDGDLYASEVHFESAIRGVVEAYEYDVGIITMLGQRIQVDVGTVIGEGLDDRHLLGKSISVSGWLNDAEVAATRMTLNEEELSEITGYASHITLADATLSVGDINVDCSGVAAMPPVAQGDVVKVTGTVWLSEDKKTRRFAAQELVVLDTAEVVDQAEQIVVSGVVRNVQLGRLIVVNGLDINLTGTTVVDNGVLRDIGAGASVTVRAEHWRDMIIATHVHIDSADVIESVTGEITAVEQVDEEIIVTVADKAVAVKQDTAIVDLAETHSRLTAEQLLVGDYVVLEAALSEGVLEAKTLKRTAVGENDRLFESNDEAPYQWYFTPGDINPNDKYENVLGARRFGSVDVENNYIFTVDGLRLKLRNSNISDQNGTQYTAAEILALLAVEEGSDRMIWLNYQVDSREGNIWLDKLRVLWDVEGDNVDFPIP